MSEKFRFAFNPKEIISNTPKLKLAPLALLLISALNGGCQILPQLSNSNKKNELKHQLPNEKILENRTESDVEVGQNLKDSLNRVNLSNVKDSPTSFKLLKDPRSSDYYLVYSPNGQVNLNYLKKEATTNQTFNNAFNLLIPPANTQTQTSSNDLLNNLFINSTAIGNLQKVGEEAAKQIKSWGVEEKVLEFNQAREARENEIKEQLNKITKEDFASFLNSSYEKKVETAKASSEKMVEGYKEISKPEFPLPNLGNSDELGKILYSMLTDKSIMKNKKLLSKIKNKFSLYEMNLPGGKEYVLLFNTPDITEVSDSSGNKRIYINGYGALKVKNAGGAGFIQPFDPKSYFKLLPQKNVDLLFQAGIPIIPEIDLSNQPNNVGKILETSQKTDFSNHSLFTIFSGVEIESTASIKGKTINVMENSTLKLSGTLTDTTILVQGDAKIITEDRLGQSYIYRKYNENELAKAESKNEAIKKQNNTRLKEFWKANFRKTNPPNPIKPNQNNRKSQQPHNNLTNANHYSPTPPTTTNPNNQQHPNQPTPTSTTEPITNAN